MAVVYNSDESTADSLASTFQTGSEDEPMDTINKESNTEKSNNKNYKVMEREKQATRETVCIKMC